MDVCLSLLAKTSGHLPSAPLRDAVEGLFRVFAHRLTTTGAALRRQALSKRYPESAAILHALPVLSSA